MTSMGMTAPREHAATRVFAVFALLIGLLAMHGLASTHHAAIAATTPHGAPSVPAPVAEGAHGHTSAMSPAVHGTAALVAGPGETCDDTCPEIAMLCVAVLTGAALVLLLARRSASLLLLPSHRTRGPAPVPPVRHARGPDPVRALCVSRT